MKVVRWMFIGLAALCLIVGVGLGMAWIRTGPGELPEGSESPSRLAPSPHAVGHVELEWVDRTRPTAANGEYSGSSVRTFPVALWFPKGAEGQHPLLVYSHGFMSGRHGCTYMAEHLASHGYVVVSADFPLSNMKAPGGLVSIEGGTHAGFTHLTAGLLRLLGNPDKLGCAAAAAEATGSVEESQNSFVGLFGSQELGLLEPTEYRPPCATTYEEVMRAARQQLITVLAVRAFFESRFAGDARTREEHEVFLTKTLPSELGEVTYTPSRRGDPDV